MEFNLTTPPLFFSDYSLLMLAYTNRFLTLATIIRNLGDKYKSNHDESLLGRIANLRYRLYLIRNIQIVGVLSLLFCVISMFALFASRIPAGQWSFAVVVILLLISLGISLLELQISVGALKSLRTDLEGQEKAE